MAPNLMICTTTQFSKLPTRYFDAVFRLLGNLFEILVLYDSFRIWPAFAYTAMTFCELHTPCKNGGTCLDEGDDKYVCVCPKCECSNTEPFDNCTLGMYILQAVLGCCHATISGKVLTY